jgi:hypothetical protein
VARRTRIEPAVSPPAKQQFAPPGANVSRPDGNGELGTFLPLDGNEPYVGRFTHIVNFLNGSHVESVIARLQ